MKWIFLYLAVSAGTGALLGYGAHGGTAEAACQGAGLGIITPIALVFFGMFAEATIRASCGSATAEWDEDEDDD